MTEAEIVRLAQTGDAEAFEYLYRVHSRRVYVLCLQMTRNPSLAEDLTQETFLQVFRKIQTFRGKSSLFHMAVPRCVQCGLDELPNQEIQGDVSRRIM